MIDSFLQFLTYEKRYSQHTVASYGADLEQFSTFLKHHYEIPAAEKATHPMIRDWIVHLSNSGLSKRSINRKIITLRSYFKFLIKRGLSEKNPVLGIKALKTSGTLPHFIREEDMQKILDQITFEDDFNGKRDQLVIELLYGTGIRLSELIKLSEKNVDFFEHQIKVLGKRNKERIIPINKSLELLIRNYLDLKNEVFGANTGELLIVTNKGAPSYPMLITRIVKKYLGITSVDKKSPHVLRHTFATHLLERGADLNAVKDLLGHQSLAATQVYTHSSLGKLKKVFDQAHPKA